MPGLQKRLLKELPGILNWSLAGLRALNEQGSFTNTADQERLIRELEMINDYYYNLEVLRNDVADYIDFFKFDDDFISEKYSSQSLDQAENFGRLFVFLKSAPLKFTIL